MKVEVAVLGSPVPKKPCGFCGRKAPWKKKEKPSELGSCVKVEVDDLGSPVPNKSPYGLCGRKAEVEEEEGKGVSEFGSCVKVEVAVLGSAVPNKPYGFCGRKATLNLNYASCSDC